MASLAFAGTSYGMARSGTMDKLKKIDAFFKRKASNKDEKCITSTSTLEKHHSDDQTVQLDEQPCKIQKVTMDEFDVNCLERDPGKRPQI
ncbi:hypothetical protein RND71_031768 [Anisodus tanguticus]|uniref:Uncharacterized protein n=1 Tax=Anisodus tanguticus TaxID=243964 RepID=A0AAE1UXS9_9SOLA|nr:hypothetical protein RND71_031768 [Anisodus tanguticus]